MIASGSKYEFGDLKFTVNAFLGPYVELEMNDGFESNRVYIPLEHLLNYDQLKNSSDLLRYMIDPPQDVDFERFTG